MNIPKRSNTLETVITISEIILLENIYSLKSNMKYKTFIFDKERMDGFIDFGMYTIAFEIFSCTGDLSIVSFCRSHFWSDPKDKNQNFISKITE